MGKRGHRGVVCLAFLGALAACATSGSGSRAPAALVAIEEQPAWMGIASAADRDRLARLDAAWSAGLSEARGRFRKKLAAEGELLDPKAALPRPELPPGRYRCRVVKLGSIRRRQPAFAAYPPFFCYVEHEGELLTLVKETGSERPSGRLWPDRPTRMVFLGALILGREKQAAAYGETSARDIVGVVERVGPFRWRMVTPWPRRDAKLEVMEMVPFTGA